MPHFAQLTADERRDRLRALALGGLERYQLTEPRCTFVAETFNTVFRIDDRDGERHAWRVSPPVRIHPDNAEIAEAAWLLALRNDTDVEVPVAETAIDGSVCTWISGPEVPEPRSCVLFEWVDGRPLHQDISIGLMRQTGQLAARLHEHGAGYTATAPKPVPVADRVVYLQIESRDTQLGSSDRALLAEATDRAQHVIDDLWRDPPTSPHVLHGDLHPPNVIVRDGRVAPIDFQDMFWGFEIQDLAITVCALRDCPDADVLIGAFTLGYESVRRWPESDPDTFDALVAARRLHLLHLWLELTPPGYEALVARELEMLRAWMHGPAA